MFSRYVARGVGLRGLATKSRCAHKGDHAKPETLPPPPQGTFKDTGVCPFSLFDQLFVLQAEDHLEYYPTVEEQWPAEIPAGMAMCNLEQFKSQAVDPGRCWKVWRCTCKYDVLPEIQRLQLTYALHLWMQSVPDSEVKKLPEDIIGDYTV